MPRPLACLRCRAQPGASMPADPLASNVGREQRPKPVPPMPHRLMADVDAPLKQQVFDIAQRQWKSDVHHHHQPDHLGRELK